MFDKKNLIFFNYGGPIYIECENKKNKVFDLPCLTFVSNNQPMDNTILQWLLFLKM